MVVSAEKARAKAEARRARILAKSAERLDVVSGLAPDSKAEKSDVAAVVDNGDNEPWWCVVGGIGSPARETGAISVMADETPHQARVAPQRPKSRCLGSDHITAAGRSLTEPYQGPLIPTTPIRWVQ